VADIDSRTAHDDECSCMVTAIIYVHDRNHNPVKNVTVSGRWSTGVTGSCKKKTDNSGMCEMQLSIPSYHGTVNFSVTNLTGPAPYDASYNHDPDTSGNNYSNGTTITINH
jgi:hypothetical protein